MKETTKFDDFSGDKAISLAKTFAKDAYTKELGVVLSVAFSDIRNLPALGFNQDEPIPSKNMSRNGFHDTFRDTMAGRRNGMAKNPRQNQIPP